MVIVVWTKEVRGTMVDSDRGKQIWIAVVMQVWAGARVSQKVFEHFYEALHVFIEQDDDNDVFYGFHPYIIQVMYVKDAYLESAGCKLSSDI
jgi:hypothetical protein